MGVFLDKLKIFRFSEKVIYIINEILFNNDS